MYYIQFGRKFYFINKVLLGISVLLHLTACTTHSWHFPLVYAIDVEQGNMIDQPMIDQLRPNMNKRQVLYIMGTPMLIDIFHEERWDYINSVQPGGDDRMQKRLSLYFKDDRLNDIKGDFKPSSKPVPRPSNDVTVDVPPRVLEKTLSEKFTGLFSSDEGYSKPTQQTIITETGSNDAASEQTDSDTQFETFPLEDTEEAP